MVRNEPVGHNRRVPRWGEHAAFDTVEHRKAGGIGMPKSTMRTAQPGSRGVALAIALLVLAAWLVLSLGPWHALLTDHAVHQWMHLHGALAPAAAILVMIVHAFVPFPAEAAAMAIGALFGPGLGTLLTWTGAMIGATLSYALARWVGARLPSRRGGRAGLGQLQRWSSNAGASGWLLARLIPLISFNLLNYAAGLARLPAVTFLWTTAVGILPLTVASVALGGGLSSLPAWLWPPLMVLVVAAFAWRRHADQEPEETP